MKNFNFTQILTKVSNVFIPIDEKFYILRLVLVCQILSHRANDAFTEAVSEKAVKVWQDLDLIFKLKIIQEVYIRERFGA